MYTGSQSLYVHIHMNHYTCNYIIYRRESLINCSSYSRIQRVTHNMMIDYTVQHSLAVDLLFAAGHSKGGGVAVPDGDSESEPPE